ncbi:hypothetical protein NFI96_017377, partial [Prochilodus magdalenae]
TKVVGWNSWKSLSEYQPSTVWGKEVLTTAWNPTMNLHAMGCFDSLVKQVEDNSALLAGVAICIAAMEIKEERLTHQRQEKKTSLHCCMPLSGNSSRYNSEISFYRFPVDPEVWARWLTQIRRDNLSPLQSTRVCSRHFNTGDFVVTAVGKRKLNKGAVPCLFAWNDYSMPAPRLNVWQRRPRCPSPVLAASDTDQEMEVQIAPDHDYSKRERSTEEKKTRATTPA